MDLYRERGESLEEAAKREAEYNIAQFEQPARNLLDLLRSKINAMEFDSVLGDDAAGRIHAILLGKTIQEIYGEKKKLNTVFVQGGVQLNWNSYLWWYRSRDRNTGKISLFARGEEGLEPEERAEIESEGEDIEDLGKSTYAEEVRGYLARLKPMLGDRTLIVTEEIRSGESIETLSSILTDIGVKADAASFGVADGGEALGNPFLTKDGLSIYLGSADQTGAYVDSAHLGVVNRGRSGRGHAEASHKLAKTDAIRVKAIREAASRLAHKLAQDFLKKSESV